MKDRIRNDLKQLCYHIIENKEPEALPEQLTRVQMLYERLLLLNYLEEQESNTAETEASYGSSPEVQSQPQAGQETAAAPETKEQDSVSQTPAPEAQPEVPPAPKTAQEPVEEPVQNRPDPVKNETAPEPQEHAKGLEKPAAKQEQPEKLKPYTPSAEEPTKNKASLNDRLAQGNIEIGLNDRIAFVNQLFEGNQQDFIRVLSQLNTFTSVQEAEVFLEQLVKPDYNWEDKEEYVERLVELVRVKLGDPA